MLVLSLKHTDVPNLQLQKCFPRLLTGSASVPSYPEMPPIPKVKGTHPNSVLIWREKYAFEGNQYLQGVVH